MLTEDLDDFGLPICEANTNVIKNLVRGCCSRIGQTARTSNVRLKTDLRKLETEVCDNIDCGRYRSDGLVIHNDMDIGEDTETLVSRIEEFKSKLLAILKEYIPQFKEQAERLKIDAKHIVAAFAGIEVDHSVKEADSCLKNGQVIESKEILTQTLPVLERKWGLIVY